VSLSFIRGLVAAVNPCGFILLPTYLMYFLGIQGVAPGTQRATLKRALLVSGAVSAGFLSVFLVAGVISYNFTTWINENAKYATGGIGAALVVLGVAMLFGYKLPFMTPRVDTGQTDQTVRSMFVYGIAYAVASIGCTIGLFIATVFSTTTREGVVQGVGNVVAYGAGMALLVSALTVSLAFANTGLLHVLRRGLAYVDKIAAAFVLLSGCYLLWYFYWVDLREEGDPITDWALERQAQATTFLNDNWPAVALVMLSIVGAAASYVLSRRWSHVGAIVGAGLVVAVVLAPFLGADVWRVLFVAAVSGAAGAIGVVSAEAHPEDDPLHPAASPGVATASGSAAPVDSTDPVDA
jgi:cytochrome c-type biogenesis protein